MTANEINALVDRLREQRNLSDAEFKTILETDAYDAALQKAADEVRRAHYGTDVYVRGLIEFTNYCKITVTIVASVGIIETRRVTV